MSVRPRVLQPPLAPINQYIRLLTMMKKRSRGLGNASAGTTQIATARRTIQMKSSLKMSPSRLTVNWSRS